MFHQPADLTEALAIVAAGGCVTLCGGTDVFPALVDRPSPPLLDLSRVADLQGITRTAELIRIGAATTWSQIIRSDLPQGFDMLRTAARQVGSVQIQNRATIGGNLCNASPAADGVPPLLALDAQVELVSQHGRRLLPLYEFLQGNRRTVRRDDELLLAVHVPRSLDNARSAFLKLGARKYLVISIVMVATALDVRDGIVRQARVAVGAASAVAQRLPTLEARLVGQTAAADLGALVTDEDVAGLSPISDVRATATYRHDATREIVARALQMAADARPA